MTEIACSYSALEDSKSAGMKDYSYPFRSLLVLTDALGRVPYVGCNTHGQIAKVDWQFNGFHNCTAVVCAFPG